MSDTKPAPGTVVGQTQAKARSKASQEKGWNKIHAAARKIVAERPRDHLSSILAELRELNISRKDPGNFYRVKEMATPIGNGIMGTAGRDVADKFHYPDVREGGYTTGSISPIRYLSRQIRPETSGVMELGSGWSSNLFQLYIAHGATRSSNIIYYGGEYTKEGQVCAKFLAAREQQMKYRSFYFDYRNPDISFLVRQKGHVLLFTSHSVEQVDLINSEMFQQLKDIPNPVTVVHFEPIGWQRHAHLMEKREAGDKAYFEAIGEKVLAGELGDVSENSAWWSWRLEYNKNLIPLVDGLEAEGTIRIIRKAWDFGGAANILNPSSLIHYEFVRS